MSIDKTPEDAITDAGAVELQESQLDRAHGGDAASQPPTFTAEVETTPQGFKLVTDIHSLRK